MLQRVRPWHICDHDDEEGADSAAESVCSVLTEIAQEEEHMC
jgi:hypothetical protein